MRLLTVLILVASINDDLKEYLDSNMRAKYDYAFDNKKTQSKRKTLNVSFDVDADKQSTDDDDFDK